MNLRKIKQQRKELKYFIKMKFYMIEEGVITRQNRVEGQQIVKIIDWGKYLRASEWRQDLTGTNRALMHIETNCTLMINYSSMSKTSTTSKPLSVFSLARFRKECFFAPISVDFTPISRANQPSEPILPRFNQDKQFYTPAFVNPYDQARVTSLSTGFLQKQREKFQRKIQCNLSAPEEENVAFNPRDDLFCSMCQLGFESYWEHINSKAHLRKIKSAKANKYIHQLCDSYKQTHKNHQLSEYRKSSSFLKKKRIAKDAKKTKKPSEQEAYNKEDLIIRFPKEFFDNERLNFNMSTKGANSLAEKE